jgi:predicted 3-demethylubiquinone-9 3-methyltransferase (glyoxalase superfamily)
MQKITPFLWFDNNAEEAMIFYTSVFKNSRIDWSNPMTGAFTLDGQEFMALNGGPMYKFTPAISLFINCTDQEEVDYFWETLCEGGTPSKCGWLTDKFGVSWQVIPTILGELMYNSDPEVSQRVVQAMLKMDKLDIAGLKAAAEG